MMMNEAGTPYTAAVWIVKPGREDEFVAAWAKLGERTLEDFPNAHGTLLQANDQPNRFISFGPWESAEQIQAWRESEAFGGAIGTFRELCEDLQPGDYTLRAEAGGDGR